MSARWTRLRWLTTTLAMLLPLALLPQVVKGGGWHDSDRLICSDCHVMHASRGHQFEINTATGAISASTTAYTPQDNLLRAPSALALCVQCHDGSNLTAPDVVGERTPEYEAVDPAAGSFPSVMGSESLSSHDLGIPTAIQPPDGDTPVVMTCVTCHDPHGNGRYRNLRESPSGTGRANGVSVVVTETVTPTGGNPADVYATANLRYRSGMKAWCLDCHNRYEESSGHSGEVTIYNAFFADYDYWFNTSFETLTPPQRRLRVQNPTDTTVPSQDDQAFCLSCHKAHGSPNLPSLTPNPHGLIYADGETLDSTCNQCHNM